MDSAVESIIFSADEDDNDTSEPLDDDDDDIQGVGLLSSDSK